MKTNVKPAFTGEAASISVKASSPPADAPTPTMTIPSGSSLSL